MRRSVAVGLTVAVAGLALVGVLATVAMWPREQGWTETDAAVVQVLRSIQRAQQLRHDGREDAGYASDLETLVDGGLLGRDLLDGKLGYRFEIRGGTTYGGESVPFRSGYVVTARPLPAREDLVRTFYLHWAGVTTHDAERPAGPGSTPRTDEGVDEQLVEAIQELLRVVGRKQEAFREREGRYASSLGELDLATGRPLARRDLERGRWFGHRVEVIPLTDEDGGPVAWEEGWAIRAIPFVPGLDRTWSLDRAGTLRSEPGPEPTSPRGTR